MRAPGGKEGALPSRCSTLRYNLILEVKSEMGISPWYQGTPPIRMRNRAAGRRRSQPRRAASIAAMSIFRIVIIASKARLAAAGSGSAIASIRARGVICQYNPHLS